MSKNRVSPPRRIRSVAKTESRLLSKDPDADLVKEPNRVNPRLAIYVRRSEEKASSASLSRQLARLEAYATTLGGTYSRANDLYEDNDLSAKGGVYRPGIEALLDEVVAGNYDGLLVWEFTRLTRNRRESRIVIDLMKRHGCELYSLIEPFLSLFGSTGILVEWAAEMAAKESERISARTADWHKFKAQTGVIHSEAPFGMKRKSVPSPWADRRTNVLFLEPDETPRKSLKGESPAAVMREAFNLAEAGHSFNSIASSFNERGLKSAYGGRWTFGAVSQLLRNQTLAGYAMFRNKRVYDATGKPVRPHTPLVSVEQFDRVQDIVRARMGGSVKDSPLRGLLKCGTCQKTMSYAHKNKASATVYRCQPNTSPDCTGRSAITALPTNQYVFEAVAGVLGDPATLAATQQTNAERRAQKKAERDFEAAQRSLFALEAKELRGDFNDEGGQERLEKHQELLSENLTKAAKAVRATQRRVPAALLSAANAEDGVLAHLQQMDSQERLHLIRHLIERIDVPTIKQEPGRGPAARLRIVWRTPHVRTHGTSPVSR